MHAPAPTGVELPQADDLDTLRSALDAVCAAADWRLAWDAMDVAGYSARQSSYYRAALSYLGFIRTHRGSPQVELTGLGLRYRDAGPLSRDQLFADAVKASPAVTLATELHRQDPNRLRERIAAHASEGSTSTRLRRASTAIAWARWSVGASLEVGR